MSHAHYVAFCMQSLGAETPPDKVSITMRSAPSIHELNNNKMKDDGSAAARSVCPLKENCNYSFAHFLFDATKEINKVRI